MVDTSDVQGYANKFDNQLTKLHNAPIPQGDADEITRYVMALDSESSVKNGTIAHRVNRLRLSSERASMPLTDMNREDVDELLFALKHDHELSPGTLRNYRKALRYFYQFLDREWADGIHVGSSPKRTVDPDELLTDEEISQLLDAAPNSRDTAMIALLADTGLRLGAVCSLRVRDVDLSGEVPVVSINTEGNVKGASGSVPLTWSEGYVSSYLTNHPARSSVDAALFHKSEHVSEGEDGALSLQYAGRRLKKAASRAGIDRDRVRGHVFRKTAISRWIREGMSEQAIKHRACWDIDTNMLHAYSGVRDMELNEQILSHYGLVSEGEEGGVVLEVCPGCHSAVAPGDDFCSNCSMALSTQAISKRESAREAVTDHLVGLESAEDRAWASSVLGDTDVFVNRVADEVMDRLESV